MSQQNADDSGELQTSLFDEAHQEVKLTSEDNSPFFGGPHDGKILYFSFHSFFTSYQVSDIDIMDIIMHIIYKWWDHHPLKKTCGYGTWGHWLLVGLAVSGHGWTR